MLQFIYFTDLIKVMKRMSNEIYNPFPLSTLLNLCIKNKDLLGFFTWKRKETTFLKRGYFKKQKRKRERKVVSTISACMVYY